MQEYVTEVRWTGRERLVQADKQGAEVLDVSERLLDREVTSFLRGGALQEQSNCCSLRWFPLLLCCMYRLQSHEVLDI